MPKAPCVLSSGGRYQINARTELAVRYNDISPLENHHCAVAFQILARPECNIFANVQPDGFKQIRQVRGQGPPDGMGWVGETMSTAPGQAPHSSGRGLLSRPHPSPTRPAARPGEASPPHVYTGPCGL